MKIGSVAVVVVVLSGCAEPKSLEQQLVGHWASPTCEAYPNGSGGLNYLKRDFVLSNPTQWALQLTLFGDASCLSPFVGLAVGGGSFQVGNPSAAVSGATEVDYHFAYRKITPLSDAGATALGQACGGSWSTGVEQDVSQAGCPGFGAPSLANCPTEHDLNKLDGNSLFFGDRSISLCAKRPTALGSYSVVRQ